MHQQIGRSVCIDADIDSTALLRHWQFSACRWRPARSQPVVRVEVRECSGECSKSPEADLGMFSMFGRTGGPTERGPPQEDRQIFATLQHARNN